MDASDHQVVRALPRRKSARRQTRAGSRGREAEVARRILDLERQLARAQKLATIGRLAGGVAHDFNNLLTIILGHADLLLAQLPANSPVRSTIDEIQRAAESAAALTTQLLTVSRRQAEEPELVDLNACISELDLMLRRVMGEDVELRLALHPDPGLVRMDRGQVDQILLNLVVNARDAMPNGGVVTIETAPMVVTSAPPCARAALGPGPYLTLRVADTGVGIAPEMLARIFEPFFTTKDPARSSGLGLSTVESIAARAGGTVGVSSQLGRGTTVTVYLPQVRTEQ